eukprot:gene10048-biopygen403
MSSPDIVAHLWNAYLCQGLTLSSLSSARPPILMPCSAAIVTLLPTEIQLPTLLDAPPLLRQMPVEACRARIRGRD